MRMSQGKNQLMPINALIDRESIVQQRVLQRDQRLDNILERVDRRQGDSDSE